MANLSSIDGFEWDEGNHLKNWLKHEVSASECEEVFFNLPLLLSADLKHSQVEPRYYVLGRTKNGRPLFVSFALRESKIRVISARPMSRKERQIYAESNS
jgi:uncharacterized DUF497 family protein